MEKMITMNAFRALQTAFVVTKINVTVAELDMKEMKIMSVLNVAKGMQKIYQVFASPAFLGAVAKFQMTVHTA
jgi:hypothetical protein